MPDVSVVCRIIRRFKNMNKKAIKAAAFCLSAAMFSAALIPSAADFRSVIQSSVVYAEAGQDLIKNPDCDTKDKYGLYLDGGAKAKLTASDGCLDVAITEVGELNYGVQLNYPIIPLYKGAKYELSFDIKTDCPRYTEAMIQMDGGDYRSYVWVDCDVTEEWQTVKKTFTMEEDDDIASKLCFNMGNESEAKNDKLKLDEYLTTPHHFYVDNVHVTIIDDSDVDYDAGKAPEAPVLTNQLGYLPEADKVAVIRMTDALKGLDVPEEFSVVNKATDEAVFTGKLSEAVENKSAKETNYYADFSSVKTEGTYYIQCGPAKSYEFKIGKDVYNDVLDASVYMLYTQRCGTAVEGDAMTHAACHTGEATVYGTDKKIDVTGGWHDAGDYGRYVVPAAQTVADLMLAYSANKSVFGDNTGIPESGNNVPDILDEARYELEWMLKMQDKETGGVYHKVSCANFPGMTAMPETEKKPLIVTPVSTTATADFCAAMAMASEYYADIDADFASKCLDAAKSAWAFLEAHPEFIFKDQAPDITTGEYGDKSDEDERYWAACQMYRATGDAKYMESITYTKTGLGWANVGTFGTIAYLTMDESKQDAALKEKMENSIFKQADSYLASAKKNPYGEALGGYFWGCNMDAANGGLVLNFAETLDSTKGYAKAASEQINYLLGKNPLGYSFVTGYGTVAAENPHHRPSLATGKCVPGMLVGGPNSELQDTKAEAFLADAPPAKCWLDNSDSYSTNEIAIYWNSPFTALLAEVIANAEGTAVTPPSVDPTTPPSDDPTTPPAEGVILGDLDGDTKVDLTDLSIMAVKLVDKKTFEGDMKTAADVDKSGVVDLADLATLRQFISKVIDKF